MIGGRSAWTSYYPKTYVRDTVTRIKVHALFIHEIHREDFILFIVIDNAADYFNSSTHRFIPKLYFIFSVSPGVIIVDKGTALWVGWVVISQCCCFHPEYPLIMAI